MIEVLETFKINATNGKENFCYISEKQLKALKELAKRDKQEIDRLNNIINELEDSLKDIKSIITHEQFESMEYKVGDSG